jgi:hypothetical protein
MRLDRLGQVMIGSKSTKRPWYSALDFVQISFMASTRSRISASRVFGSVPWSRISSRFQPAPIPNRNRPSLTRSSVATFFAVWIGSRWTTRQIPVASLSFVVTAAARAPRTARTS